MSEILPLEHSVPIYEFSTGLSGEEFFFEIRWNGRAESWFMSIFALDKSPIIAGIRIVLGTFLGIRNTDPRFPKGAFQAVDLSGEFRDAAFDDLGDRVVVYFYPAEEIFSG